MSQLTINHKVVWLQICVVVKFLIVVLLQIYRLSQAVKKAIQIGEHLTELQAKGGLHVDDS